MVEVCMRDRNPVEASKASGVAALSLVAACVLATLPLFLWRIDFQIQVLPWAAYSQGLVLLQPLSVLTSVWVHLDSDHLVYNAAVIALFGWRLERLYGAQGVIALFLLAGIPAQLAFFWGEPSDYLIVGSSGPALGLVGAFLERRIFAAHLLGRIERHPIVLGLLCVGVVVVVTQDTADVDRAHGIGFLAGALLSAVLSKGKLARAVLRAGTIVAVLHLVGVLACGVRVVAEHPSDPAAARWLLERAQHDVSVTNNLAWYWFKHPRTKPEILAEAELHLERFLDSGLPPWGKDTLAALKHRSGDLEFALELQREAVREVAHPSLFPKLARYEYESWRSKNAGAPLDSAALWEVVRDERGLRLVRSEGPEALPERAILLNGETLVGYLETRPGVVAPGIEEATELETPDPTHVTLLPLPGPGLVPDSESDATVWWVSTEADPIP